MARTQVLATAALASILHAQSPLLAQAEPDEPLRGPDVESRDAPGVNAPFAPGMTDPRMRARRVPHRDFVEAIQALAGDDAPESLRLDADTGAEIRALVREYRREFRAYQETHAEEFARLRPDRDRATTRDEARRRLSPDQRRRLRELTENAPKPDAVHARLWALLTEPQQDHIRAALEEAEDKRRMQREPDASELLPRRMLPGELVAGDRARFEAMWMRIEKLPPRARTQLLNRIESGLDRMEAERVREDRPAPSMDDVDVPPANNDKDPAQPLP